MYVDPYGAGEFSGYVDPYAGGEFSEYVPTDNTIVTDTGYGITDYWSQAAARVSAALTSKPSAGAPTLQSSLLDAIYAYGSGKIDYARQKVAGAFLMTSEGKKIQQAGVNQTIQQYMPMILVGVVGLIAIGLMMGKR